MRIIRFGAILLLLSLAGCAAAACEGAWDYSGCVNAYNDRLSRVLLGVSAAMNQSQQRNWQRQQEENDRAAAQYRIDQQEQARLAQQRKWQRDREWDRMIWEQDQERLRRQADFEAHGFR